MDASIETARQIARWAHSVCIDLPLRRESRVELAAVKFGLTQEHHVGVLTLLSTTPRQAASALALLRPAFEAFMRGLWLSQVASDSEVERLVARTLRLNTQSVVDRVANKVPHTERLKAFWDSQGEHVNDLAHSGVSHALRWASDDFLEPRYDEAELQHVLDYVGRLAILAAIELLRLSGKTSEELEAASREGLLLLPPIDL